jgi:hypothetical protein
MIHGVDDSPATVAQRLYASQLAARVHALAILTQPLAAAVSDLASEDPDAPGVDHFVMAAPMLVQALESLMEAYPLVAHGAQIIGRGTGEHPST